MATPVKLREPSAFLAGYGGVPMWKRSVLLMALFLGSVLAVPGLAEEKAREAPFHAAEIVSATEVVYPITATSWGTLVFDVGISATGEVEDVQVRRGLEPFTAKAIRAIKDWKFRPAIFRGKPVDSTVTVAVTFNPRTLLPADVPLPPLERQRETGSAQSEFQPAEVEHAVFPTYPASAVTPGTVVVEATLGEKGEVERTSVIRDLVPFTEKAVEAVQSWRFSPAKLDERPVSSTVALAFVFPTIPPPLRPNQ